MEFTFTKTVYDQETMTIMARALRKTSRKKGSKVRYFFLALIVVLCVFFTLPAAGQQFAITGRVVFTWLVTALLFVTLVFEDKLNGFFANRRAIVKNDVVSAVFTEDGYTTISTMGQTKWAYDKIRFLAESQTHFVFVLSNNHGQAYDKRSFEGGSLEAFRGLLKEWTEKETITKI